MWEILARNIDDPGRFPEADGDTNAPDDLRSVGGLLVTLDNPTVESIITGHPNLTAAEAAEIADQAEVVIREALLARGDIVDV